MTLCSWCMSAEHDREHCPQFAAVSAASAHGIIDPMHDEDPQDRLALRYIAERVAKGQYRRLCLEAGIPIPSEVLDLDPDRSLYAA